MSSRLQNGHDALYIHYREIEDVKSGMSSRGSNPRPSDPSDDLWLHLQIDLLASLFRLIQRDYSTNPLLLSNDNLSRAELGCETPLPGPAGIGLNKDASYRQVENVESTPPLVVEYCW